MARCFKAFDGLIIADSKVEILTTIYLQNLHPKSYSLDLSNAARLNIEEAYAESNEHLKLASSPGKVLMYSEIYRGSISAPTLGRDSFPLHRLRL